MFEETGGKGRLRNDPNLKERSEDLFVSLLMPIKLLEKSEEIHGGSR